MNSYIAMNVAINVNVLMSQQLLAPSRAAVHTGLVLWCVERRPAVQIIVVDVKEVR